MMTNKDKRPRSVTITLLGVMLLGVWNAAEALVVARQIDFLLALNIKPDPRFLLIIAAGWMIMFWASAIALWHRRPIVRWLIPLLVLLYALYELVMQGLFVPIPISGQSWLLRILLYDVAILFALWSLNRRAAKAYFAAVQFTTSNDDRD